MEIFSAVIHHSQNPIRNPPFPLIRKREPNITHTQLHHRIYAYIKTGLLWNAVRAAVDGEELADGVWWAVTGILETRGQHVPDKECEDDVECYLTYHPGSGYIADLPAIDARLGVLSTRISSWRAFGRGRRRRRKWVGKRRSGESTKDDEELHCCC